MNMLSRTLERMAGVFVLFGGMAWAQAATPPPLPSFAGDPVVLVRQAVDLEMAAAQDTSHPYRYVLRKETNSGNTVRQMLEADTGLILAKTLQVNGGPPKAEDQMKEQAKLEELVRDAEAREKKFKSQRADNDRVMSLLRALPFSSLYTYDGEDTIQGRQAVRLAFTPNPHFDPDAKETYLLKAAVGKMWIDRESRRMVRIQGTLTDSVNIGWGLLGHIDKGGSFFLEQSLVPGGAWRITQMRIDAKGKALIFKSIVIKQHQMAFDFMPVKPLSVAEAVQTLKQLGGTTTTTNAAR
jgi:hypothetical protein